MDNNCKLTPVLTFFFPQFFLKEGVLKKMSRKVLQPRMFFLVNKKNTHTLMPLFCLTFERLSLSVGQAKLRNRQQSIKLTNSIFIVIPFSQ